MKNINNKKYTKSCFDNWYKEYQTFMRWNDAPSYELEFYYSKDHCTSYYNKDENGTHIITINELLIPTHRNNAKAIAFHEFTHLFDRCNINGDDTLLNICGEYHAVIVQMKCAMNFKMVDDNIIISENDVVYDGIKTYNVRDYIKYITHNVKFTIEDYLSHIDEEHILEAIRHSIYYFAQIDFFNDHIDNKKDICGLYDLFFITKIFGVDIAVLHILLQKLDSSNKNQLSEIQSWICKIGNDYLNINVK